MTKKCLNPKCEKEFTPKNKKGVYCSGNCRAAHAYQLSKEPKPEEQKSNREKYLESCPIVDGIKEVNMAKLFEALEADGFRNILEPTSTLTGLPSSEPIYAKDHKFGEVYKIENNATQKRITGLRNELKNPPKNPQIGLRKWIAIREYEIKKLEQNLKDN